MKTVLVSAYAEYNLGDDLFLKILIERYPEVQFRVIAQPSYQEIFKKYKNVTVTQVQVLSLFTRVILRLAEFISVRRRNEILLNIYKKFYLKEKELSDGFIYIGGSLFQDNGGIVLGNEIDKVIAEVFQDKPKFIIGANFGPYLTKTYLDFYRDIFRKYTDICFREQHSKDLFSDLSNIRFCPDIVFQLDLPKIDKEENSIGFSLIDISWRKDLCTYENDYLEFVSRIMEAGINKGSSIYLFSFFKREGDEKVISKVLETIHPTMRDKINIITYNGDIDMFLSQYAKVESMFATRFHSMILSFLLDQNIFPLVYSEKMTNVLKDLNYQGTWSRISELKSIDYSECLKNITNNRLKISSSVIEKSREHFLVIDENIANL